MGLVAIDVRVFGNVAREEETDMRDVDLLGELGPNVGAFASGWRQSPPTFWSRLSGVDQRRGSVAHATASSTVTTTR
ncbi:hypothetical protein ACDF64_07770 [Agromyces sp. MMS24-JH15]|uniref:hypothetical protein n=1 Tax=Agromyces sp. MMS24-JH15 TaxID=3243765 RepID=UPI00374A3B88